LPEHVFDASNANLAAQRHPPGKSLRNIRSRRNVGFDFVGREKTQAAEDFNQVRKDCEAIAMEVSIEVDPVNSSVPFIERPRR
jgi:hypothetical protein